MLKGLFTEPKNPGFFFIGIALLYNMYMINIYSRVHGLDDFEPAHKTTYALDYSE